MSEETGVWPNREAQLEQAMREYCLPRMEMLAGLLRGKPDMWGAAGNLAEEMERCRKILAWEDAPADPLPTTEADLRRMMRDPRYWRTREPEHVKKVTDGFKHLFGVKP